MRLAGMTRAALVVAAVVAAGCDLFKTRDPESPSQISSNFVPPTDPSIVFQNLSNAFRDMNSVNYMRSLSDTTTGAPLFRFDPTVQARSKYASVFAGWSRQSEQQYFESMKTQLMSGSTMTLEYTSLTPQSLSSDSAQYEAVYRLVVPHTVPGVATVATGRAQFWLAPDRSRWWSISRWVDLAQTTNEFTWSDFKGSFGQ